MCSTKIFLAMIFNEIKCHVNTSLGLVGGCIPCIPPCVRACRSPLAGLQRASGKTFGAYTNVQDQVILPNKVGGPGGQRFKKDLCGQRTVLVPRASRMQSERGDGVAAV